jgi:4-diphosphocytidyl-2-C-methyl-D-erythritol kinase
MTLLRRSKLTLFSPAKLNFFFLVLGKRSDNFHEIASLYQAIDIFDRIDFEIANEDQITSNNKDLENSANSIITALNLFRKKFDIPYKLKIHLEKIIPTEAGLGGGSSNAATTLFALNKLFRNDNNLEDIIELAKEIGSDVPFFFSQGSALCTGKGEIVDNISIPPISGWVLKPIFSISTPKVYASIKDIKLKHNYQMLLQKFQMNELIFINDLQSYAETVEPLLIKVQKQYQEATMTGSGSCFFTLKKPNKSNLIEQIFPFKSIFRKKCQWYSINQ